MATAVATAMRQQGALERIEKATAKLRDRFELGIVDLAPQNRDAAIARADQLEQLAVLIEEIEEKTRPATEQAPAAGKRKGEAR